MSVLPATSSIPPAPASQYDGAGLADTDIDQFLKLMITELQNQDPLNPMDNGQMLQQLSDMRSIASNDKLTETLEAVLVGQNVSTASALIGKEVDALTDEGNNVHGVVERVTVQASEENDGVGKVRVHVNDKSIALGNIREIMPGAVN
ncbi:MAG: flagellar hook capping FlgD N-terminal domain-containing protein [Pirellulaceae bacterium]